MPSGKRAKQQRRQAAQRTPPPVRSKGVGGVRPRQASPRALAIAGGVALVAVIAIVGLVYYFLYLEPRKDRYWNVSGDTSEELARVG